MALNRQVFKTRTITAIVFAAVMLLGVLWNKWSFLVLFTVIHFGCWWEYLQLTEKIQQTVFHIYVKLGLMVMGYGLVLWFCGPMYHLSNYGLKENLSLPVSAAGFALLFTGIFQQHQIKLRPFLAAFLGLIYISLSWGLMMQFREVGYGFEGYKIVQDFGYSIPLGIIVSIWVNDTMAYIVGSLIGKTPLSKISPKKTWEGTIGGLLLATAITGYGYSFLVDRYMFPMVSRNGWYAIAALASIAGTVGDLFESKLKRMAGVKDSGNFMPGHGGFLDRFDSLLFAVPAVWLWLYFTAG